MEEGSVLGSCDLPRWLNPWHFALLQDAPRIELHQEDVAEPDIGSKQISLSLPSDEDILIRVSSHAMAYVVGGGAELFRPILGPIRQEFHQEDVAEPDIGGKQIQRGLSGDEDVTVLIGSHSPARVVGDRAELFDTKGNSGRPSAPSVPSSISASVFASTSVTADDANYKEKPSYQGSG